MSGNDIKQKQKGRHTHHVATNSHYKSDIVWKYLYLLNTSSGRNKNTKTLSNREKKKQLFVTKHLVVNGWNKWVNQSGIKDAWVQGNKEGTMMKLPSEEGTQGTEVSSGSGLNGLWLPGVGGVEYTAELGVRTETDWRKITVTVEPAKRPGSETAQDHWKRELASWSLEKAPNCNELRLSQGRETREQMCNWEMH